MKTIIVQSKEHANLTVEFQLGSTKRGYSTRERYLRDGVVNSSWSPTRWYPTPEERDQVAYSRVRPEDYAAALRA